MTVEEYIGTFNGEVRHDDYQITIHHPNSDPRSFLGLKMIITWESERRTCYYVGNQQAGRLGEIAGDPIVEGSYTDYKVASLFATSYIYNHFIEGNCETAA